MDPAATAAVVAATWSARALKTGGGTAIASGPLGGGAAEAESAATAATIGSVGASDFSSASRSIMACSSLSGAACVLRPGFETPG
jgi:hypothetical protein